MIGVSYKSASFSDVLRYVLRESVTKDQEYQSEILSPRIINGNVVGTTAADLSKEFTLLARQRENKKPVWHLVLSADPSDTLDDAHWGQLAESSLSKMGLDLERHQWCVVRHYDEDVAESVLKPRHEHVHIVANRVSDCGDWFSLDNDYDRVKDVVRQVEQESDFLQTKHHTALVSKVQNAAKEAPTLLEFCTNLKSKEITPQLFVGYLKEEEDKKKNIVVDISEIDETSERLGFIGIAYYFEGKRYTGSELGRDFSLPGLKRKFKLDCDYERDLQSAIQRGYTEKQSYTLRPPNLACIEVQLVDRQHKLTPRLRTWIEGFAGNPNEIETEDLDYSKLRYELEVLCGRTGQGREIIPESREFPGEGNSSVGESGGTLRSSGVVDVIGDRQSDAIDRALRSSRRLNRSISQLAERINPKDTERRKKRAAISLGSLRQTLEDYGKTQPSLSGSNQESRTIDSDSAREAKDSEGFNSGSDRQPNQIDHNSSGTSGTNLWTESKSRKYRGGDRQDQSDSRRPEIVSAELFSQMDATGSAGNSSDQRSTILQSEQNNQQSEQSNRESNQNRRENAASRQQRDSVETHRGTTRQTLTRKRKRVAKKQEGLSID